MRLAKEIDWQIVEIFLCPLSHQMCAMPAVLVLRSRFGDDKNRQEKEHDQTAGAAILAVLFYHFPTGGDTALGEKRCLGSDLCAYRWMVSMDAPLSGKIGSPMRLELMSSNCRPITKS